MNNFSLLTRIRNEHENIALQVDLIAKKRFKFGYLEKRNVLNM